MMDISPQAKIFRPQPGPQMEFLSSDVDFCLYGGGAGGGKTYAIILEGLRYHNLPQARVLVFRRQSKDIEQPGGLWDTMNSVYSECGAESNKQSHRFKFPSGMQLTCAHLNLESDKYSYQGAQELAAIFFDELTHFTATQFWYMFSRARNTYGVRSYVRATCNPEPGWLRDFIAWYIGEDGKVIPSRAGAVRYFYRDGDTVVWGNSREEVVAKADCEKEDVKSFQFIPASIEDNEVLMQSNGREYIASIKLTGSVEAERLLNCNWNIKKEGKIFKQSEFMIYTKAPIDLDCKIITADTAQKEGEANDWSVLQLWGRKENKIYLLDQLRGKYAYPDLKLMALSFIEKHSNDLNAIFVEDKVSGTALIQDLKRSIAIPVFAVQRSKDKYTRAYDTQGYVSAGHVYVSPLKDYYTDFINEVISFSADGSHDHDDQCDTFFDAVDKLLINPYRPIKARNDDGYASLSRKIC